MRTIKERRQAALRGRWTAQGWRVGSAKFDPYDWMLSAPRAADFIVRRQRVLEHEQSAVCWIADIHMVAIIGGCAVSAFYSFSGLQDRRRFPLEEIPTIAIVSVRASRVG